MSLINEALKRAQHLRKEESAGHATPPPGDPGHRVAHRGKPMASQTLMLIVAGSVAIVVITVVVTVYLLRDDKTSPALDRAAAPAVVKTPEAPPSVSTETTPAVVLSIPNQAAGTTSAQRGTAPVPVPVAAKPTPPAPKPAAPVTQPATPPIAAATVASPAPITTAPAATTPLTPAPAAAAHVAPDQQVLIYLDNMRVLGVRFSGLDSKVLIGDRVFRINDIIERNFGLRLVEVQPDRLFFVDARGAAYTKNL